MQKSRQIYLASNKKIDGVINLKLLKIEFFDFEIEINNFDGFIFTSKNAVKSMAKNYDLKDLDCYAISTPTAKELEKYGANIKYVGKSAHGNEFALELAEILKDKKVVYIRAKKVASKLLEILKEKNINCEDIIAYETRCNNNTKKLEKNSIIIFTSPSTINCFMNNYSWQNSFHAVVIGQTTAKSLPKNINYTISNIQTIENCIEIARQI